uniref:Zinc finger protein-like 1 homolog n=1 Tax=Globodera rostochiensis TaxID=31243 RepID=A0A914HJQ5_GLORO
MGLCKCPKRKVTNLFCFEHRVNVCESCLLSNHDSCVVQTYLSWLTDSDYDANCLLCFESLNSKETLRLKCLHLFHWDCFDSRARQLPQTTAPAGYKCPSCLECIFPSENQSSPVVDKLRTKLQTVNWGRFGLGLSSIPELEQNALATKAVETNSSANNRSDGIHHHKTPVVANSPKTSNQIAAHDDPFEVNTFTARAKFTDSGGNVSSRVNIGNEDDSKYVKAAAAERNIRNRFSRLPRSLKRVLMALIVVTFLYIIFGLFISGHDSSQGQNAGEDTLFDPLANPNIKVRAER